MQSSAAKPATSFAADSLAGGLMLMLALTVIQRGIGFLRGIWFCRLLDDATVGLWAMGFGFIALITPVMMLGLPGALPRFVERYRTAGQLPALLRRVIGGTLLGSAILLGLMLIAPQHFGWLVFRQNSSTLLIGALAAGIVSTLVFNFVIELVASLRQVRVNSVMQFIQGVGFTFLGIGWLYLGGSLIGLLFCYSLATALGTLPGLWVLARGWSGLPVATQRFDSRGMWRSLLPYAIALWTINLLTNLFEVSDRYMILHFSGGGQAAAQAAVGQYHSGRIIPMLLVNIATMYAGVLMPYLVADWEAGHKSAATDRLRRTLMVVSLSFTAGACGAILIAPLLFGTLLQGRYSEGLAVMPQAFVICIWAALITMAQLHVWLNEQGKWFGAVLAAGIVANLVLNFLWLPAYGLQGAVAATLVSTALVLLGLAGLMGRLGYRVDADWVWCAMLPLTLLSGVVAASISVVLVIALLPQVRALLVSVWASVAVRIERREARASGQA
jgi:polysaccharide transporter, PST family